MKADLKEKRGVVYTKPWVVDLILDLVGYTSSQPLYQRQIVEPCAGSGAFLRPIVTRLAQSCAHHDVPLIGCQNAIVAFELDAASVAQSRKVVREVLEGNGVSSQDAEGLACVWVQTGNYLLEADASAGLFADHSARLADYVVGNPPYIRLEDLGEDGALYRALYPTMVGRADIYVAFFEAALKHLQPGGACGLICADRWMFNQYGAELRRFITRSFGVEAVIQMHQADAFEREVSAYPAITIIRNAPQGPVTVAVLGAEAEHVDAPALAKELCQESCQEHPTSHNTRASRTTRAARIDRWFTGNAPWPLIEPERLALLRRIEAEFPPLEATGAPVGIGVATGADRVFITMDPDLVEPSRMLPLAMAGDVKGGALRWSGHYLVNPWNGQGLVNLEDYPRLTAHLTQHKTQLQERHVGRKSPTRWYRTIDRVNGPLTARSKLYLPDFKGRIAPVLDRGETYPHHNLYFIAPELWEAEVLGGLLLSNVAQFFVEAYGVQMRGGYLRFQAQYVRRIRVPRFAALSSQQTGQLQRAFETHDVAAANEAAAQIYRLTSRERALLGY